MRSSEYFFYGEPSRLISSSDSECAGEALRTEQPSRRYLADLKAMLLKVGKVSKPVCTPRAPLPS
jgi:hypothetical protein